MRDLEIGDLSLIVRRIFGLPDDADAKVTERLKHMRKLGFPSAAKVGQGHRRTYGVGDALKVAVGFQLIDAGLASALAVRLTVRHWPAIAQSLVGAISGGGGRVELKPNVVTDLSRTASKGWDGGTCAVKAALRRRQSVGGAGPAGRPDMVPSPAIVLDLALLVRSAKRALMSIEGVAGNEIEDALASFRPPTSGDGSKAGASTPEAGSAR